MNRIGLFLIIIVLFAACGGSEKDKSAASDKREAWMNSLQDSLEVTRSELQSAMDRSMQEDSIAIQLAKEFRQVSNPKHVESYLIVSGFEKYAVESQTGLIARITENRRLELIATLKGGTFTHIQITAGAQTVSSDEVPFDQALNYRLGNVNIVAFSGAKADSIAQFIADHRDAKIQVSYMGKSKSGALTLSDKQKEMITKTWKYIDAVNRSEEYSMQALLLKEKIKIFETALNR